jgi:hypothetical protein
VTGYSDDHEPATNTANPDIHKLFATAAVVPTPADAPLIDRLVAWTGRPP